MMNQVSLSCRFAEMDSLDFALGSNYMKRIILSFFFTLLMANGAYANCQWEYVNQLNKIIKNAGGLLSDYSTCRDNCNALAGDRNSSIANMNKAAACGSHILTKANSDMITFIAGRFRLIQKQKMGSTWTKSATVKPVITATEKVTVSDIDPVTIDNKPVFIKPEVFKAPQKEQMRISQEAYAALWQNKPRTPRPNVQRTVKRQAHHNNNAKQKQLAQRRLIQHRKQALIQQNKMRQVKARKVAMQNHVNKQRLARQRLLRKRALMRHQDRLRARQLKLARAQRVRR